MWLTFSELHSKFGDDVMNERNKYQSTEWVEKKGLHHNNSEYQSLQQNKCVYILWLAWYGIHQYCLTVVDY